VSGATWSRSSESRDVTGCDESDPFIAVARNHQTPDELAEIEVAVDTIKALLARLEERLENDMDG
jgi:hypothetical protein